MKSIKRLSRLKKEKSTISNCQKNSSDNITSNTDISNNIRPKSQILDSITSISAAKTIRISLEEKCPYPLTIDCLEEIFSHLIDDKLTLFSCIQVNRLWLSLCVPLLWNNPFDGITYEKGKFLIGTYISCLSKQDKQKLLKFSNYTIDNNIMNNNNKRKKYPIISIQTKLFSKIDYHQKDSLKYFQVSLNHEPLFIYSKYLTSLNYDNFDLAIKNWSYHNGYPYLCYWNDPSTTYSLHEHLNLILQLLNNLIFNDNSIVLKHLKMRFGDKFKHPLYDNNNHIKIMTTAVNTFKLTTLDLSYLYSSGVDKIIPQHILNICSNLLTNSKHIQYLTIYVQEWWGDEFKQQVCHSLFNLIKSQRSLKSLSINEFWNMDYNVEYFNQFYQILLQHNSNTLKYLQFNKLTQFPTFASKFCSLLSSLPKLHSLTITKFCYFTDIDSSYLATNLPSNLYHFKTDLFNNSESLSYFLENCSMELSILEVYQQLVSDDTLKSIINYKKNGGKLREFRYSGRRIKFTTQIWESTKKILPDLVKVNWSNNNYNYYNY